MLDFEGHDLAPDPEADAENARLYTNNRRKKYVTDHPERVIQQQSDTYYKHRESRLDRLKVRYQADPAVLARIKAWQKANPLRMALSAMLTNARERAEKANVPFNITINDISIPDICPVLGIPISRGIGQAHDNSPTLDRTVPELGYVVGNVEVISRRANTIKSFGTAEEHRLIVVYIDSKVSSGPSS